jgi:hypothetical protein
MARMVRDDRILHPRPALRCFCNWFDRSGLLIPLVFLAVMVWLAPISYPAEFDTDEGVNLMKALLVDRGHRLYTEIWSDQPPVLTLLLAETIRAFGASVTAARALVLLFSALLIWAFSQALRMSTSRAAALLGVLLLLSSAWYVRLSIAVMVGLPALALAMLSTYFFLLSYRSRGRDAPGQGTPPAPLSRTPDRSTAQPDEKSPAMQSPRRKCLSSHSGTRSAFLAVSGVTLALAMQTKLLAGMLAPVLLAYALFVANTDSGQPGNGRRRLVDAVVWSAALLVSFVLVGFLFRSLDLSQLVQPHLGPGIRSAFAGDNLIVVKDLLVRQIGLLPFASAGVIWSLRERRRIVWLPLGWSLMALAFLLYERPLWYHHITVITVPLAWLAALGADVWIRTLWKRNPYRTSPAGPQAQGVGGVLRWSAIALTGMVCLYLVFFGPFTLRPRVLGELFGLTPPYDEEVAAFMRQGYAGQPGWVFTDRPIYAFRAGLPVPPPITVLTVKRMRSSGVSDQEMAGALQSYRPEVVVLERFRPDYGPVFRGALASRYEPVLSSPMTEVWVPVLPAALREGSASAGFQRHEFDGWLTLAVPDAALPAEIRAGDDLRVGGLWWLRADDRTGLPLSVSMRLVDEAGQVWSQSDTSLGTELVDLRSQSHVRQSLSIHVPEDVPAGDYQVSIVVYDPQTGQPLAPSSALGAEEALASLGRVTVDKSPQDGYRPAPGQAPRRALADFGVIRLLRAQTPATVVGPGDSVPVSLTWQAGRRFGGDPLVVVIQLLDDQDRVVASLEEEPLSGRYPTARWQPGELVGDRHGLSVPLGVQPGRYRLAIGLYRAVDRERLNAGGGFLDLLPRNYFTAGVVEVR